jgi:hypothetical protein
MGVVDFDPYALPEPDSTPVVPCAEVLVTTDVDAANELAAELWVSAGSRRGHTAHRPTGRVLSL